MTDIQTMDIICYQLAGHKNFKEQASVFKFATKYIKFEEKSFQQYVQIIAPIKNWDPDYTLIINPTKSGKN